MQAQVTSKSVRPNFEDFGEQAFWGLTTRRFARKVSTDRKSTRLNSSHSQISYAVFCLKKKKHGGRAGHGAGSSAAAYGRAPGTLGTTAPESGPGRPGAPGGQGGARRPCAATDRPNLGR